MPPDLATGQRPERVGAVIVTYFAHASSVVALLQHIGPQVEAVVVVDNTPEPTAWDLPPAAHRIDNRRNLGLAAAQNQGIERLRAQGMTHVLLLDQDSVPAADMVEHLLQALRRLEARSIAVAAVGPRWCDRLSGRDVPFVRLGFGRMVAATNGNADGIVECDTLVSSGCLIPLSVVDAVGLMDEALFIDQVETEWGLRAQRRRYRLYGVRSAVLTHGIGESFVRPWFAPGRSVPVHVPIRDYFLIRNTIAVFFRRAAPWRWRLLQLLRLPALIVVLVTQMPPRHTRLRYIARGLIDGLRGRLGAAPVA